MHIKSYPLWCVQGTEMASTGERVLPVPRPWPLGYMSMNSLLQRALVMATSVENRRIDQQFVANPCDSDVSHPPRLVASITEKSPQQEEKLTLRAFSYSIPSSQVCKAAPQPALTVSNRPHLARCPDTQGWVYL